MAVPTGRILSLYCIIITRPFCAAVAATGGGSELRLLADDPCAGLTQFLVHNHPNALVALSLQQLTATVCGLYTLQNSPLLNYGCKLYHGHTRGPSSG